MADSLAQKSPEALWTKTQIADSGTHHTLNNKPLYAARFQTVQKFHAPGLAPVQDDSGAYHIDITGNPVYPSRYLRTFGFYEDKAAVCEKNGWFHLLPDGTPLYKQRYEVFLPARCDAVSKQPNGYNVEQTLTMC